MHTRIDRTHGELLIALDLWWSTPDDQLIAQALAETCVGPGKSIQCIEEAGLILNTIRVKIDGDSILGRLLDSPG